jgi:hypothetical protein
MELGGELVERLGGLRSSGSAVATSTTVAMGPAGLTTIS